MRHDLNQLEGCFQRGRSPVRVRLSLSSKTNLATSWGVYGALSYNSDFISRCSAWVFSYWKHLGQDKSENWNMANSEYLKLCVDFRYRCAFQQPFSRMLLAAVGHIGRSFNPKNDVYCVGVRCSRCVLDILRTDSAYIDSSCGRKFVQFCGGQ